MDHTNRTPTDRGTARIGGLGLAVLTCDPILDLYRSGHLNMKELSALSSCTNSEEVGAIARAHARSRIAGAASVLRTLTRAAHDMSARVSGAVWDTERRLAQLEVPRGLLHPTLDTPLCPDRMPHPAASYEDVARALLPITHPAAWAPRPSPSAAGLWAQLASAAGGFIARPCLVLMLSEILPVEGRSAYLKLQHASYAAMGATTLEEMLACVLGRMMTYPYSQADMARVSKGLQQVAACLHPFSLFLLKEVCKGRLTPDNVLATQREALSRSAARLLTSQGDRALYSPSAWTAWLASLDTPALLAFYVTYLCEGFH